MTKKTDGTWAAKAVAGEYAATGAANAPDMKDYVVEGILPRKGTAIVFGPGSTGKTQFLLWLACHLAATGQEAPGMFLGSPIRRRGQVLILSAEDLREDIFLRIKGIAEQMRREGHNLAAEALCSRLHVIPFLSLEDDEFCAPSPSLFARDRRGEWRGTATLDGVERFIASWNLAADRDDEPDRKIIGVIMDSAVSMAGFELANSEATTNLLFRINRASRRQDVFWTIIGHTPKESKIDDPIENAVGRLRGSAMWSTTPRTVIELRTAGDHENLTDVKRVHPGIKARDVVVAMVVKANSKGADFRPRVLRRLEEGAFENITDTFPSVCENYAEKQHATLDVALLQVDAVRQLLRAMTSGEAGAVVKRKDLQIEFRKHQATIPGLEGMRDSVDSKKAESRGTLAFAIKKLADGGELHQPRNGSVEVIALAPSLRHAA